MKKFVTATFLFRRPKNLLTKKDITIEAIVINPGQCFSGVRKLRSEARKKSIPFILFTLRFEQQVKELAMELKVDDYQYGTITLPVNYLDFFKRLRVFKNSRRSVTEKPGSSENPGQARWTDVLIAALTLLLLPPVLIIISLGYKAWITGTTVYSLSKSWLRV